MAKKTIVTDSAFDHRTSGIEENDYDPWFYETCRMVSIACDKFWTKTEERIMLNDLYYKSRSNKYGY
jgi:hypothetical protein